MDNIQVYVCVCECTHVCVGSVGRDNQQVNKVNALNKITPGNEIITWQEVR